LIVDKEEGEEEVETSPGSKKQINLEFITKEIVTNS